MPRYATGCTGTHIGNEDSPLVTDARCPTNDIISGFNVIAIPHLIGQWFRRISQLNNSRARNNLSDQSAVKQALSFEV